jgi:MFS family permease
MAPLAVSAMARLCSAGFLAINVALALVTGIAALFFAFGGYLGQLGISPAMSGLVLSADALAALIVQPLIAPLINPASARRWLAGGSLLLAAALFALAHVTSLPGLLAARLVQGSGFICVLSALTALLVGFIPPAMSGRAFGLASLVRLLPYAVVPFAFDRYAPAVRDFATLLDAAAAIALLPLFLLLLPATAAAPTDTGSGGGAAGVPGFAGLAASLRSPAVAVVLGSALLFFCAYAAIFFFLRPYGAARGIANVSLFFTVTTLVMIAARLAGGALFDRYDKSWLASAGLLLVAASYAGLAFDVGPTAFFVLAVLTGLGWGVAMPLQAAAMFDISDAPARAMNQNLLLVMMQGGFFVGPAGGGVLISAFGYAVFFAVLAAATLVSAALMLNLRRLAPAAASAS